MFLNNIQQLIDIEWGRPYLWDVRFVSDDRRKLPPPPFDDWFPAVDVEEPKGVIRTLDINAFLCTYKVPQGTSPEDLRITFLDDARHSLLNWFSAWIKSISSVHQNYVLTLKESVRVIQVVKLALDKSQLESAQYSIIPGNNQALAFRGSSQGNDVVKYTMSFEVVGKAIGKAIGK